KECFMNNDIEVGNSKFALPQYRVYFNDVLATKYKPIAYSHECLSGDPQAICYRIIANDATQDMCIQFFFYWANQYCMMASHRYDYEAIFIYLEANDPNPQLIVNGGLGGPECGFHKNEIRPRAGERTGHELHFSEKTSSKPYYPFGKDDGSLKCEGCSEQYPLNGDDLRFEDQHPLFGIRACSNVFSGASYDLQGKRFDPPLKRLTDDVLTEWYFKHYNDEDDMPFGHDVSDPFSYPYIKYHSAREALPKPNK
ncbi:MAG TPA: hypothetical protein VFI70_13945, partial [Nitrososphaeraceae archaeon]|nr:hypothetical protein [Nitrososphaeraceae archaeon]